MTDAALLRGAHADREPTQAERARARDLAHAAQLDAETVLHLCRTREMVEGLRARLWDDVQQGRYGMAAEGEILVALCADLAIALAASPVTPAQAALGRVRETIVAWRSDGYGGETYSADRLLNAIERALEPTP